MGDDFFGMDGRRIAILGVELRCVAPDYCGDYRVMFSDHLRFERPHNRLLFNADCLALPDALSGHFCMAPSTLRRKLAGEGQSYQGLKDQVRRDLVIARLDIGASNFSELAFDLGLADTRAFYKAFKKWTGTTPGQYRALHSPD